jgi:hypothetical protein
MNTLGPGIHVHTAPQRFIGIELGARMTVLETDQGVLVHSPLDVDPALVEPFGPLRFVVAPNLFHHLYVGRWVEAGAEAWAAAGLDEKRPDLRFAGVLTPGVQPFGDDVLVIPLQCFSFSNEVVLLHRPSRTLVVTDLLFHIQPDAPLFTRIAMGAVGGYPGCCTSLIEKVGFKRSIARQEMAMLAGLDFDRIVLSHGKVVETDGQAIFRKAMAWLGI